MHAELFMGAGCRPRSPISISMLRHSRVCSLHWAFS